MVGVPDGLGTRCGDGGMRKEDLLDDYEGRTVDELREHLRDEVQLGKLEHTWAKPFFGSKSVRLRSPRLSSVTCSRDE